MPARPVVGTAVSIPLDLTPEQVEEVSVDVSGERRFVGMACREEIVRMLRPPRAVVRERLPMTGAGCLCD